MSTEQFTIVREFDAPREVIWRAWTDPEIAAQWWHPHGLVTPADSVEIDARQGRSYEYTMVDEATGREWPTGGIYFEVREPERLKFTWSDPADPDSEPPIVTIDLRELEGGRCEMTFQLLGIADDRDDEDGVYGGWSESFEELDQVLAG